MRPVSRGYRYPEFRVQPVALGLLVLLGRRDHRDQLVQMGNRVYQDSLVSRASLDSRVLRDR